ncbi:MAG TPA: Ig-like domain-containing protein, partial [Nannocystis sp.]
EPSAAWEDIEGNQYPRKHTLYLNFNGGVLYGGEDNSAEDKSALARAGQPYPGWNKAESTALAVIQRVKEDMATLGVRVAYDKRPNKTVPYTMAMVSGDWTDVNIDSPAGGVAPGTDCEARGQRHVVYVFDNQASTVGQEAAHSWGLDHTLGGDRIMSYQFGTNKHFGDNCQALCEEACQGKGSIGCRLIHEKYCGVDSEQQNDLAELSFIFGGNEPDTEPPTVKITNPPDGTVLAVGESTQLVGEVHDNYGGVGWKLTIVVDGEVKLDQVDYDRALSWSLQKLPAGVYEITLEAEDHADHIVRDTITITVGNPAPPDTDTDGTGTGSDSNSGSDSGDTPTTSDTDDSAGTGGGETDAGSDASGEGSDTSSEDDGGGCRISSGSQGPLGLLVPVLGLGLAWRGRRRRA